jgi:hypothetical protein
MPQTVVVAAGTTQAASATLTIAAGAINTYCIYAATGAVQPDQSASIDYVTPGGTVSIGYLSNSFPAIQVQGPAQVVITKQPSATSCGVLQEA